MKKKLILTLLTTATVASATLVAVISRKSSVNRLSAIEPNIGSIIIDVDDPLVKLTDSTEVVYKSALGNSFTFASYYVDIEDGCYKLDEQDGRLLNRTVINGISSFSVKPITMVTGLGIVIIFLSILAAIYALISYVAGRVEPGWTSLILSIWFLGGVQLLCIGLIGQYIGKIYIDVKHIPRYNIEKILADK